MPLSSALEPAAAGETAALDIRASCAAGPAASGVVSENITYERDVLFEGGIVGSKKVRYLYPAISL